MTPLRRFLRIAAVLLAIVMIVVLVQVVRRDGPAALEAWHNAHVQWPWVIFAISCALAGHAVYVVGWKRLLTDLGVDTSYWLLVRMLLVSNLGRYLPAGKAWQMGIVAMMASENQLPTGAVAASSLFQGIIGVVVGSLVLFAAGGTALGISAAWLALPIMATIGLLAAPRIIRSLPRLRTAIIKHLPAIDSVSPGTMWALIWTSAASWIAWGVALYGLATALLPDPVASLVSYLTAWTGSFLAGLLVVVSPAGLGAREGVMQVVLTGAGMTPGDVLVIVAVTRVWVTLLDVVPAAIVMIWRRPVQSVHSK